jgi:magnesium transporter
MVRGLAVEVKDLPMADIGNELIVHEDDGALAPEFVHAVAAAVQEEDTQQVRALVRDLHRADTADLIEHLRPDDRLVFIDLLGRTFDVQALTDIDETVRDQLLEELPSGKIASAVRRLDSDDAVYLLENLNKEDQQEILAKVPKADREALRRSLDYDEDTAGRLMQTEFVAVPAFWSVGQTIDYMRTEEDLPNSFIEVFVINPHFHLVGTVPISRILRTARNASIEQIMDTDQTIFNVDDDQEDVAYKFEQYHLASAGVVDGDQRLVGMVTVDDVVDVIREEAEEDIARLAGLGDQEITDSIWRTTRIRFGWLLMNLATAVLASFVISLFDATIQQMVALAILMPIVASMGGNAGTQTMTVAVRAIATRDLSAVNAMRVILRETSVGIINGLVFAIIMGLFAWWWFGSDALGLVIGAAMVINMVVAALAGILIPLTLEKFDIDPAIASSVFVTTMTDVVGFFAFLGLAAVYLL